MLGIDFAAIANAKACSEEHFVANGEYPERTPHISIRGARFRLRSVQCRRAGRAIVRQSLNSPLKSAHQRSLAAAKLAVNMCGDVDLNTARKMALETLAMLVDGPEWREGTSAFLEKREPRFRT
jgi:enoyl-CoA hydratase/carnithine racemase